MKVKETEEVIKYLTKRGITRRYVSAKLMIESGHGDKVRLKKMAPKSSNVWYFRITQKYRALASIKNDVLVVFEIWDHQ